MGMDYVAVAGLLIALVGLLISYKAHQQADRAIQQAHCAHRAAVRPVLVFSVGRDKGWWLENVGNGPALNVHIAGRNNRAECFETCDKIQRISPLAANANHFVGLNAPLEFGCWYDDFEGRTYESTCYNERTTVRRVREGQPVWDETKVQRCFYPRPPIGSSSSGQPTTSSTGGSTTTTEG